MQTPKPRQKKLPSLKSLKGFAKGMDKTGLREKNDRLSPRPLMVDAVAKKAEREMKKAGLKLEDLLTDLDRQRDARTPRT